MRPNLLCPILLLLFLLSSWCLAADDSHGEVDRVQDLPEFLADHPLQAQNVTAEVSSGGTSSWEKREEWEKHSRKSSSGGGASGGKGGGRTGGGGSQSIRQPRNTKSSSPSIQQSLSSSLLRFGIPCLMLFISLT